MMTTRVPVETKVLTCIGCGARAPAVVVQASRADSCGYPTREGEDPARLIVTSWRTPEGWGRLAVELAEPGGVSGDLCPGCQPKVREALRRVVRVSFAE